MIMANNKKALSQGSGNGNENRNQADEDLSQGSYQGQSGLADKETLEKLFQDHAIGETPSCIEGRTGTEALLPVPIMAIEPEGLGADDKAIRRERQRSAASDERRGLEADDDGMPNRAD
jgi:hypothetical protein